jgi:hypothetical protein
MSKIICTQLSRLAHQQSRFLKDEEHAAVTMTRTVQDMFFPDPTVVTSAEKPPTKNKEDRRRRVDAITMYIQPDNPWAFKVGALWECKKESATDADIEKCEVQLFEACQRLVTAPEERCYAISAIGSFWRIFLYGDQGKIWDSLTGERDGEPHISHYMDLSDEFQSSLINAILRDIRELMKYAESQIS